VPDLDRREQWHAVVGHHYRLRAEQVVRHENRQNTCGPSSFAALELRFAPSAEFSFTRRIGWPDQVDAAEARRLDQAIEAGIRDALQPRGGVPYLATGVSAECVSVGWDEVGSSPISFYAAAWQATTELRDAAAWELVASS
jgi:hypothetical protein